MTDIIFFIFIYKIQSNFHENRIAQNSCEHNTVHDYNLAN
jgi:hypothetical protein